MIAQEIPIPIHDHRRKAVDCTLTFCFSPLPQLRLVRIEFWRARTSMDGFPDLHCATYCYTSAVPSHSRATPRRSRERDFGELHYGVRQRRRYPGAVAPSPGTARNSDNARLLSASAFRWLVSASSRNYIARTLFNLRSRRIRGRRTPRDAPSTRRVRQRVAPIRDHGV